MIVAVKKHLYSLIVLQLLLLYSRSAFAQDTIKFETIHSIKDIPHATLKQKWMWIHRSIAFMFMKEGGAPAYDTAYYSSYKGKLIVTIPVSTRFTNFQLKDAASSRFLKFAPNYQYDVGISINAKFASFLINSGITFFKNDEGAKGKTTYTDYQFNLYGKRSTIDIALQTYKGFYVQNANTYENFNTSHENKYEIRPDVSVLSLGLNYYRLFNYKKFSYRSSFAFTEQQKKSAGSFLAGGYFSLFALSADSSLVSQSFTSYFDSLAYIKSGAVINGGFNIGYIYTLVIRKKIYATLSLVQGLGADQTSVTRKDDSESKSNFRFSSKQNLRIALGYDAGKLFFGTMGMFDFYYFDNRKESTFDYSSGKFRVFIGYRFGVEKQRKKLLQKLNLIDYRL